jgi:hypothetical protein
MEETLDADGLCIENAFTWLSMSENFWIQRHQMQLGNYMPLKLAHLFRKTLYFSVVAELYQNHSRLYYSHKIISILVTPSNIWLLNNEYKILITWQQNRWEAGENCLACQASHCSLFFFDSDTMLHIPYYTIIGEVKLPLCRKMNSEAFCILVTQVSIFLCHVLVACQETEVRR